ncbi:hypothetical protein [Aquimarina sp. 2304DJ70-9]|uniref:hypothetical protein n=1 Tax=Aquimarina penaris TaxID=3231044 RepID=UPI0034626A09
MKIKETIVKLIAFGTIILLIALLIKKVSPPNVDNYYAAISDKISNNKEPSYYFIGSSRVQKSVNPKILRDHFNNSNIHNTAISSSTFLSNCILADYLIRTQGSNVLFIELSPIIPELPKGLIKFSNEANINITETIKALTKKENLRQKTIINLNALNSYFFLKTPLKESMKRILNHNNDSEKSSTKLMGFISLKGNNFYSTTPFITYKEINYSSKKNKNLKSYHNYINYLLELSELYDSKIVFFLPVTYLKEKEKDIVIPLYNSLPDSVKIRYSKGFIESITNANYLLDGNHFNNKGATKYTNLLCPLLEGYFTTTNK